MDSCRSTVAWSVVFVIYLLAWMFVSMDLVVWDGILTCTKVLNTVSISAVSSYSTSSALRV